MKCCLQYEDERFINELSVASKGGREANTCMNTHTHTKILPYHKFFWHKSNAIFRKHTISLIFLGNIWNYLASKWKIFFLKTIFFSDIMSLAFIGINSETSLKSQKNNLSLWISVYLWFSVILSLPDLLGYSLLPLKFTLKYVELIMMVTVV